MVNVDVRLIVQVVINIVDNAIKYTDEGSEITISSFVRGKKVVIEVADNGSGISEQDKKCIFDMFFTCTLCPKIQMGTLNRTRII